jgi:hypothetical protein
MGFYGVHSDAQWELLHLVDEAKAFAKAVKSDNAGVPNHLWNDHILTAGMPKEWRNKALTGFRKLGFKLFRQGLVKDCCAFMAWAHGKNWMKGRRRDGSGAFTKLGRDQRAISSMIWHSSRMSWFEFNAGSRLIRLRFLERYCREARDGVRAFFEKPGLITCQAQPVIKDSEIWSKTKDKVGKVIQWRYMLPAGTPGMSVKSFIKYFAVPKGKDNIRMVYNATANKLNEAVWVPTFLVAVDQHPSAKLQARLVDDGSRHQRHVSELSVA